MPNTPTFHYSIIPYGSTGQWSQKIMGFSLALACKDLGLACELGREHGVPLEIGGLIEQIFIRTKMQYGDDKNSTQAVKLLEDTLNNYLRAAGY